MAEHHPATDLLINDQVQKQTQGFISLVILILLVILSAVGMEGYLKANEENQMVRRETQSRQALYAAEGGVEWAKGCLRDQPGVREGQFNLETGRVQVVIEASGGDYKVTSEAHTGLAFRKIKVVLRSVSGHWIVKSYQELHY